jgi:hypothetical protein
MNVRVLTVFVAVAILLPTLARGGADDFSDEALKRGTLDIDASLRAVQHEIEEEYSESVKFETRLKRERLDFERQMLEHRREFLQGLRGLPPERRPEAFELFTRDQRKRRSQFLQHQQERRDRFDSDDGRKERKRRREQVEDYEDTRIDPPEMDLLTS